MFGVSSWVPKVFSTVPVVLGGISCYVAYSVAVHQALSSKNVYDYGGQYISDNCVAFWRNYYASAFIGQIAFWPEFWTFEWVPFLMRPGTYWDLVVALERGVANAMRSVRKWWKSEMRRLERLRKKKSKGKRRRTNKSR